MINLIDKDTITGEAITFLTTRYYWAKDSLT